MASVIGLPNSRADVERKSEANDITVESTDGSGREASVSPDTVTKQHSLVSCFRQFSSHISPESTRRFGVT